MSTTTLELDSSTAEEIRARARAERKSESEVVRDLLHPPAQPVIPRVIPGLGRYRSGRSDISERAEEILAEGLGRRRGTDR